MTPVPSEAPPITFDGDRRGPPTRLYPYRDATARLLGCVARWDRTDEKEIRPYVVVRRADGSLVWISRSFPEPRPLFGADEIAKRPDAPVLVVEGEKTAEGAAKLLPETVVCTWPGGSNAVGKADWSQLSGRDVKLWPDNDEAGRRAMTDLAAILRPIARTVGIVELPENLPKKWDLGDPVPDGVDVPAILAAAREAVPGLRQYILSASELAALAIPTRSFIIYPIFVEGGLFMVYAERGLGKTWFALQVSLDVAQGESFFGFEVLRARYVLFVDGEMSMGELQQRLVMLGGDMAEHLLLLPSERLFREDRPLNINSEEDQQRILEVIAQLESEGRRPDLMVFDNLSSLSGGIDENDNSALDSLLRWLVGIKHRGIAVLLVHHAGKSGAQRGASRREDLLDTSIALERRPDRKGDDEDEEPHQGAEFVVKFVKTRGKKPVPDEFLLQLNEVSESRVQWIKNHIVDVSSRDKTLRVIALKLPKTQKEIAEIRKVSKGLVSQHCKQLHGGWLSEGAPNWP